MKACSKPSIPHHWSNFYTVDAFRKSGGQMVERLADYLVESQEKRHDHVLPFSPPEKRLEYWKSKLKNKTGTEPGALWKANLLEEVLTQSNRLHDPRYAGHQVAVPLPQLAWLQAATALLNNGMAIDEMGPASSPMEEAVMQELAQFMGLGGSSSGILCHGGTLANLTALLAGRQRKASGNAWKDGSVRPCAVLVSEQAHYCVDRAVRVMGWGEAGIVKVRTLSNHQIDPEALRESLAEATAQGLEVIAVVGNACTTSTGTFDDLEMLASFAQQNGLWFHVDGAHGAAQIFSERNKAPLKGIEKADSVAMDFHKMLGVPALCTGLFYRNGSDAYSAFSQEAAYLYENEQAEEWWNLSKRTFECTKRMLSVAVFGIWEAHGHKLWESLVDRLVDRAQTAARAIVLRPHWELFAHPQSNIVCFRLKGTDNAALRHAMLEHGPYYIVKTVLNGETWLRCTFQNPLTEDGDIEVLLDRLEELAESAITLP